MIATGLRQAGQTRPVEGTDRLGSSMRKRNHETWRVRQRHRYRCGACTAVGSGVVVSAVVGATAASACS
jgi:hypothetical protein